MTAVDEALKVMNEAKLEIWRLRKANTELSAALSEVRELIQGYVDVVDGDYGQPRPNKAMQATSLIDEAMGKS